MDFIASALTDIHKREQVLQEYLTWLDTQIETAAMYNERVAFILAKTTLVDLLAQEG